MQTACCRAAWAAGLVLFSIVTTGSALAGEREQALALQNLQHIIVVMQENHSFDNYFGALAYAPGSVYHPPGADRDDEHGRGDQNGRGDEDRDDGAACHPRDHRCVDGLT